MNSLYTNEQLTKLYEQTQKSVYAVAYSIVKNEQDACDLTQDTYISAFTNLEKLNDIDKFDKWIIQIAANKCKDFLRKKKPTLFSQFGEEDEDFVEDIPDNSENYNPDAIIENKEKREIIKDILYSLPEDQRLCLVLYYGQELKISEIATALDVSENTVKSRLSYGKKKMKEQIDELEKKGTKLHGITGIGILPLIKQLFASQSFASPPAGAIHAAEIVNNITKATSTAKKVSVASKVVSNATSIVTKNLATKIASAALAAIVATTATVAIVKSNVFSNNLNDIVSQVSSNYETTSKPYDETKDFVESVVDDTATSSEEITSSQTSSKTDTTTSIKEVASSETETSSEEATSSSEPDASDETSTDTKKCIGAHYIIKPRSGASKVLVDDMFHAEYISGCGNNVCDVEYHNKEPHKMVDARCIECGYMQLNDKEICVFYYPDCDTCDYECCSIYYSEFINDTECKSVFMHHVKDFEISPDGEISYSGSKFSGEEECGEHLFNEEGRCLNCGYIKDDK